MNNKVLLLVCMLGLLATGVQAQSFQGRGDHTFGFGITPGYHWGHGVGFQGSYDVGVHEFFSVGGQLNLDFNDSHHHHDHDHSHMGMFIGGRGNFHILNAIEEVNGPFDLYVGASLGMRIHDGAHFGAGGHLGFRWNFRPRWAMYTELGSGGVFGLTMKL